MTSYTSFKRTERLFTRRQRTSAAKASGARSIVRRRPADDHLRHGVHQESRALVGVRRRPPNFARGLARGNRLADGSLYDYARPHPLFCRRDGIGNRVRELGEVLEVTIHQEIQKREIREGEAPAEPRFGRRFGGSLTLPLANGSLGHSPPKRGDVRGENVVRSRKPRSCRSR